MTVSEIKKIKCLFPVLLCLVVGCLPQGRLGPGPNTEIVVLDPELSTQQTISECNIKANRKAQNNRLNDSNVFVGFQRQENFGECMNSKGFILGIQ